jgi:hypothetical protein
MSLHKAARHLLLPLLPSPPNRRHETRSKSKRNVYLLLQNYSPVEWMRGKTWQPSAQQQRLVNLVDTSDEWLVQRSHVLFIIAL